MHFSAASSTAEAISARNMFCTYGSLPSLRTWHAQMAAAAPHMMHAPEACQRSTALCTTASQLSRQQPQLACCSSRHGSTDMQLHQAFAGRRIHSPPSSSSRRRSGRCTQLLCVLRLTMLMHCTSRSILNPHQRAPLLQQLHCVRMLCRRTSIIRAVGNPPPPPPLPPPDDNGEAAGGAGGGEGFGASDPEAGGVDLTPEEAARFGGGRDSVGRARQRAEVGETPPPDPPPPFRCVLGRPPGWTIGFSADCPKGLMPLAACLYQLVSHTIHYGPPYELQPVVRGVVALKFSEFTCPCGLCHQQMPVQRLHPVLPVL